MLSIIGDSDVTFTQLAALAAKHEDDPQIMSLVLHEDDPLVLHQ